MPVILIIVSLLLSTPSRAAEGDCRAAKWSFHRAQSGAENQKAFLLLPRDQLEAFFLGELTLENLAPSPVSYDMARYLIDTEANKQKKSFFEILRWGADLYSRDSQPSRMTLDKICDLKKKLIP